MTIKTNEKFEHEIKMDNLLFKSSRDRNIDGINEALLNGANINCSNEYGWTPLHVASLYCNVEVIKLLIKKGADINKKDQTGRKPIDVTGKKIIRDILTYEDREEYDKRYKVLIKLLRSKYLISPIILYHILKNYDTV